MEILFGYRYKTPDGFNGIVSKLSKTHVWMEIVSSWEHIPMKVKRHIKRYPLEHIKIFNDVNFNPNN